MTKPKDILPLIKFVSLALELNLLTKDEVIAWAEKVVEDEDSPDILFIDVLLLNAQDIKFLIARLYEEFAFTDTPNYARPFFALLHKCFVNGKISLFKTIKTLSRLKYNTGLSFAEECWIYALDDRFDLAYNNIHGEIDEVQKPLQIF